MWNKILVTADQPNTKPRKTQTTMTLMEVITKEILRRSVEETAKARAAEVQESADPKELAIRDYISKTDFGCAKAAVIGLAELMTGYKLKAASTGYANQGTIVVAKSNINRHEHPVGSIGITIGKKGGTFALGQPASRRTALKEGDWRAATIGEEAQFRLAMQVQQAEWDNLVAYVSGFDIDTFK